MENMNDFVSQLIQGICRIPRKSSGVSQMQNCRIVNDQSSSNNMPQTHANYKLKNSTKPTYPQISCRSQIKTASTSFNIARVVHFPAKNAIKLSDTSELVKCLRQMQMTRRQAAVTRSDESALF
jgi:hypothetical protein